MQTAKRIFNKLKAPLAILIVFGNVLFVGFFAWQYAAEHVAGILVVNGVCAALQKWGISIAAVGMAVAVKGQLSNVGKLVHFRATEHPIYFIGFVLNRLSSLTPPVYTLTVAGTRLPWLITLYLIGDIAVALWAARHMDQWIQRMAGAVDQRLHPT